MSTLKDLTLDQYNILDRVKKNKKNKPFFVLPADKGGVYWYRLRQPSLVMAQALQTHAIEEIFPLIDPLVEAIQPLGILTSRQTDNLAVILHYKRLDYIRRHRVPFYMDLDDNLWVYNPGSEYKLEHKKQKILNKNILRMDHIITSTDYLAQEVFKRTKHPSIRVLPNLISRQMFNNVQELNQTMGEKPKGLWAGSPTHLSDLLPVVEAIKATSHLIDWTFFGYCPEILQPFVTYHPKQIMPEAYFNWLKDFKPDIAIAPLIDHGFNRAKSHVKLLEMGSVGAAVITSRVEAYKHFKGITISPDDDPETVTRNWVGALSQLAKDKEILLTYRLISQHYASQYILESTEWENKILSVYKELVNQKERQPLKTN